MKNTDQLKTISLNSDQMIIQLSPEIFSKTVNLQFNNSGMAINQFCKINKFKSSRKNNAIILSDSLISEGSFPPYTRGSQIPDRIINLSIGDITYFCEQLLNMLPIPTGKTSNITTISLVSDFINSLNVFDKQKASNEGLEYQSLSDKSKNIFDTDFCFRIIIEPTHSLLPCLSLLF